MPVPSRHMLCIPQVPPHAVQLAVSCCWLLHEQQTVCLSCCNTLLTLLTHPNCAGARRRMRFLMCRCRHTPRSPPCSSPRAAAGCCAAPGAAAAQCSAGPGGLGGLPCCSRPWLLLAACTACYAAGRAPASGEFLSALGSNCWESFVE
jgi:hypothetical protein